MEFRNTGPSDIASLHFDAERGIRISVKTRMLGMVGTNDFLLQVTEDDLKAARNSPHVPTLTILPQILRCGDSWIIECIVSGSPEVHVESSLIDVAQKNHTQRIKPTNFNETKSKPVVKTILFMQNEHETGESSIQEKQE